MTAPHEELLIGISTIDITPPLGVDLAGYGPRKGVADSVGHPLRAEALVCRRGASAWALVTSDVIGYPRDMVERVRARIGVATDLTPEAVALSATHTHSGPSAMRTYRAELGEIDHAYREELEDKLVQVVARTAAAAEPGTFEVAWTAAPDLAHNRRLIDADNICRNEWEDSDGQHPGYYDPAVMLVAVRRPDGRCAALLVNYGCHPVTLGPQSLAISADYVGYLKGDLEENGAAETALFALAGAGNINPRVCIHVGAEYPQTMGRHLGEIIRTAVPQLRPIASGPVVSFRQPWSFIARHDGPANTGRTKGNPVDIELLALRAGDLALITVPGELFSQYAAGFRQASPFPATAVISLANDSVGYLVTDETLAQGGLEAMRASGEGIEEPLLEHARLALAGFSILTRVTDRE